MAANPALVRTHAGELVPAPFPHEYIALRRPGVTMDLDGLMVRGGRWSNCAGVAYLTNYRMVFVANKPDESGLHAFDFPLVYIQRDELNQPIFGANNLSGEVWPLAPDGRPDSARPPHKFRLYFMNGGMGTFYPLFYMLKQRARAALDAPRMAHREAATPSAPPMEAVVARAFVDPNDPSTLYLTQPVDESQRLPEQPRYATNYGQDEKYEDMGLRP